MATSDLINCMQKLDSNNPLMRWIIINFIVLDKYIEQYNADEDENLLKQVCEEVVIALKLAGLNSSLLTEFLDSKKYNSRIDDNFYSDEFISIFMKLRLMNLETEMSWVDYSFYMFDICIKRKASNKVILEMCNGVLEALKISNANPTLLTEFLIKNKHNFQKTNSISDEIQKNK